jgi:hypothetical protein
MSKVVLSLRPYRYGCMDETPLDDTSRLVKSVICSINPILFVNQVTSLSESTGMCKNPRHSVPGGGLRSVTKMIATCQ